MRYCVKVVTKPRRNGLELGTDRRIHELSNPTVNKLQKDDEEGVAKAKRFVDCFRELSNFVVATLRL